MQIPQWIFNESTLHLSAILSLFFVTFCRVLGKDFFWVIDDIEGIARFSDRWTQEKDKDGKITKEFKVDSYEIGEGDKKKTVKFLSFIPELGFPGNILRFIRLHIGKQFKVIGTNKKGHEVWGYVQSPIRHHFLSMTVQALNLVFAYIFLSSVLPAPIAFGACLLFSVHPLTTQCVGWISGINYSLSMLVSLALINIAIYTPFGQVQLILIAILSFVSSIILYTGCFSFIVLALLGLKWQALVSAIIGLSIFYWKGKQTKDYRTAEFKKQNMGSTTFLSWRKPIVMFKTLWYYMRVVFLPIKMGLYHVWGYFYETPIERVDRMFFLGVLVAVISVLGLIFGDYAVKIGIVWFYAFWFLFSNFITAQQFVADRYALIPSFGICIILSSLLYGTPFFWILVGLYAMRTFLHLPTFKNEIDFYLSNWLNFRKSEVSLGNLGVSYINQGMHGAAVDTWLMATKINPFYDVPWYNLYSVFKGNGRLTEARDFLKKCLDAKVVHFENKWKEEFDQLELIIANSGKPVTSTEMFYHSAAEHYKNKDIKREYECLKTFLSSDTAGLIPEMISQVKQRLGEIESGNILQLHNSVPGQERPEAPRPDQINPEPILPAGSN